MRSQQRKSKTRPGLELLSLCHHTIWALQQLLGDQVKMLLERDWTLILVQYFKRLRTWDSRIQLDSSGNLQKAFSYLNMLKDKLGLSDSIVEKTAYLYRKVEDSGLIKGRTISGMLGLLVCMLHADKAIHLGH